MEAELEAEQRRGRDLVAENRKLARLLQELKVQFDEEHRLIIELTDQNNLYANSIKVLKRQLLEAVRTSLLLPNMVLKIQLFNRSPMYNKLLVIYVTPSLAGRAHYMACTEL